jgi:hypothetical protein
MNIDLRRSIILSNIVYNDKNYEVRQEYERVYLDFYSICNKWRINNDLRKNIKKNKLYFIKDSYIICNKRDNTLYISIAGTIHNKQFMEYLFGFFEKVSEINEFCEGEYYFHSKFLEYFRKIKDKLYEIIEENNTEKIVISGHSVGGSVAVLAALIIKLKYANKLVDFYSFGAPSGCCNNLQILINNTLSKCINYHIKKDFIPKMTPKILFKYPGKIIILNDDKLDKLNRLNLKRECYFYHKIKNYYYLINRLKDNNK